MRITFLGTGVGKYEPDARGYRANTCVLADDLLIDAPPTLQTSLARAGRTAGEIRNVLYTHSHSDHFDEDTLRWLLAEAPLRAVAAGPGLADRVGVVLQDACEREGPALLRLEPGQAVEIDGLNVLPLEANHHKPGAGEVMLNFLVSRGDKAMLYLVDSGLPSWDTVGVLRAARRPVDLLVMDATEAMNDVQEMMWGHGSLQSVARAACGLRGWDLLRPDARVFGTHFGAKIVRENPPDPEAAAALGVEMAEDGMIVEL